MKTLGFAVAATLLLAAVPAAATVVGGAVTGGNSGGVFVQLTTPLANPFGAANSVGADNYQSPNLFAFNELNPTDPHEIKLALSEGDLQAYKSLSKER